MRVGSFALLRCLFGMMASLWLAAASLASQDDLNRELDGLIEDFTNKKTPINELINNSIKWSGISDARLFDAIEKELLASYSKDTSFDGVQRNSWLVQALAFSGQPKYRTTIETVMNSSKSQKLRQHAESSLKVQPDFAQWSPVIAKGLADVPPERIGKQRTINMLTAADPELSRAGASFVLSKYLHDPEMIELTKQQLIARYKQASRDLEAAEAAAWMCKVLGETGNKEFIPLLQEVKANAKQPAVERWAGKSISKLKYGSAGESQNRGQGQDHFR
jgi:hypothetical protein